MTKPLTRAQLLALEPRYTIAGLFQSGQLGAADETALEEIKATRDAFHRWLNPGRGWMTPRYGSSPPAVPRQIANAPAWRRYKDWRYRWNRRLVAPSPSTPWGLSVADVVLLLINEPYTFNDVAPMTNLTPRDLVDLFVLAVRDYGRVVDDAKRKFWAEWDRVDDDMRRQKQRRQRLVWAAKKQRYRERQRRANRKDERPSGDTPQAR